MKDFKKHLSDRWFWEGAVTMMAEGWTQDDEIKIQELIQSSESTIEKIIDEDSEFGGKAFCYFLLSKYGRSKLNSLFMGLYKNEDFDKNIKRTFRAEKNMLLSECLTFFKKRTRDFLNQSAYQTKTIDSFHLLAAIDSTSTIIERRSFQYSKLEIVSTRNEGDNTKNRGIVFYKQKRTLQKMVLRIEPSSKNIFLLAREKGKIVFYKFTSQGKLLYRNSLNGIDGTIDMNIRSENEVWITGTCGGKSDLYRFLLSSGVINQITNDLEDQLEFVVLDSSIVYRGGYPMSIDGMEVGYGIFAADFVQEGNKLEVRNGRMILKDSLWFKSNILGSSKENVHILHNNPGRWVVDTMSIQEGELMSRLTNGTSAWKEECLAQKRIKDSLDYEIEKANSNYNNEFGNLFGLPKIEIDKKKSEDFDTKPHRYQLRLFQYFLTSGVNNELLINKYQSYQSRGGVFKTPQLSAFAKGGMADVFDNYHLTFGFRLPVAANGSDYFVQLQNLKRRLDWDISYFRNVEQSYFDARAGWVDDSGLAYPTSAKTRADFIKFGINYPLNFIWRISLDAALRMDKTIFLSTDRYSLQFAAVKEFWSINSFALHGSKIKSFSPFLQSGWSLQGNVDGMVSRNNKGSYLLYVAQLNSEYFLMPKSYLSIETSFKAGVSKGNNGSVLFNFGGLDGNLTPLSDSSKIFYHNAPYTHQSLVSKLRGYAQNSTYGHGYILSNFDVYFQIFGSLISAKTKLSFINNLQIGLFFDGVKTWRSDRVLAATPDILFCFGWSARTILAGYKLRVDMSLGPSAPVWYLTLEM